MKNIILLGEKRLCLPFKNLNGSHLCDICQDPNSDPDDYESTNITFLLLSNGVLVASASQSAAHASENSGTNEESLYTLWTADLNACVEENDDVQTENDSTWFSLSFVSELNTLICLSRNGNIVSVDPRIGHCESVGAFENGISDGQWSPDEEILALFTYNADGKSVLLTMNLEFEILNEMPIPQPHKATNENNERIIPQAAMSWRPDATKIVINSIDEEDQQCRIRIYDRDTLAMESIAREEDGSGKLVKNLLSHSGVAWGGDCVSYIIAAVQKARKKKMPTIVFMEPNGLRHREFQLREEMGEAPGEANVYGLKWNIESDILAVIMDGKDTQGSRVQLWYRSNYHWYMKHELRYQNHRVNKVEFDAENPYKLNVVLNSQTENEEKIEWREYEFCWDVSTVAIGCADSTSAVIDGRNLNFTPLSKAVVPPPMYAASLQLDFPINHVVHFPFYNTDFPESNTKISAFAVLSNGDMVVLGHDENDTGSQKKASLFGNYTPPSILTHTTSTTLVEDYSSLRQYTILSGDSELNTLSIIAISCSTIQYEKMIEIQINLSTFEATIRNSISLEGHVLRTINWADSTPGAVIELTNGTLLSYDSNDGLVPLSCEPLMEPCPWISAFKMSTTMEPNSTELIFGLSKRSRLYCNDILISNATSSFVTNFYPHQVVSYTTLGSIAQLRTIPLKALSAYDPLAGLDNDINTMIQGEGYEARTVERGSVLVSVSNRDPSAILQLPRGNLEGIYPRSLVIPYVMSFISKREYSKAVEMMRKQKVDMNLIIDLNPNLMISEDAEKFVLEVEREDYLNLFIANLRDDDVTICKYPIPSWMVLERSSWNSCAAKLKNAGSKVNLICQTLRKAMLEQEQMEKCHFLLPILSTFAKEGPPKLEEALDLIRQNAVFSNNLVKQKRKLKSPYLSDQVQSSIQYLAFLADYEILYNTAIGMYDFDLAMAVARNSQLDPKVYVSQIRAWKEMKPADMAKYEVDLKLKRYDSALRHLFNAGKNTMNDEDKNFQRCYDLIEEHKLHSLGLKLFENNAKNYHNRIMISLGKRLLKEKKAKSALTIFLSTTPKDMEGAKVAARMCGDWQTYFACFESQSNLRKNAIDLADEITTSGSILNKRKNMSDISRILLDYAGDVDGALEKLIHGELWTEARRLALLHNKEYFCKRIIDAAVSYAENCCLDFDERADTFVKSNERYAIVIKIRAEAKTIEQEEYGESKFANENGSVYSMSSELSNMSLRSNMSGSSVGSVSSFSSVISAAKASSFSMTSNDDMNKHKSKFNKIGRGKKKSKKKKKTRGKSNKIRPGSQEELSSLISAMKTSCLDEDYKRVIGETIMFLAQTNQIFISQQLFSSHENFKSRINKSQSERITNVEKEREEIKRLAWKLGHNNDYFPSKVGCEEEINDLRVDDFPDYISTVFNYI